MESIEFSCRIRIVPGTSTRQAKYTISVSDREIVDDYEAQLTPGLKEFLRLACDGQSFVLQNLIK